MTLMVSLPPEAERRLADRARAAGVDLPTFVARILEVEAGRPTLTEISGKVAANFAASKMTEEELGERLEDEKHAVRAARRGKPFAE